MFNIGQLQPGQQFPLISAQPLGDGLGAAPKFGQLGGIQAPGLQAPGVMQFAEPMPDRTPSQIHGSMNVPSARVSGSTTIPAAAFGAPMGLQQHPLGGDMRAPPAAGFAFPMQQPQPMESFQFGIEAPAFNFGNFAFTAEPEDDGAAQQDNQAFADGRDTSSAFMPQSNGNGYHNDEPYQSEAPARKSSVPAPLAGDPQHAPRFGEPGYKSPFDIATPFDSPFTYKSPFDDPRSSESPVDAVRSTARASKDGSLNYATPQIASADNGPWIPPPLDNAALDAYYVMVDKPMPDCWIRCVSGNRHTPSPEIGRTSLRARNIAAAARQSNANSGVDQTLLPGQKLSPRGERAHDEDYPEVLEDTDPWSKPPVFKTKEETDEFWSQTTKAAKLRAAKLGPKKQEELEETDFSFLMNSLSGWIKDTVVSVPSMIRGSTSESIDKKSVATTRGASLKSNIPDTKLDMQRDPRRTLDGWAATQQLSTMPLTATPEDTLYPPVSHVPLAAQVPHAVQVPVRHWWSVRTINPGSSDNGTRKFSDKPVAFDQPEDCSDIMPQALLRSFGVSVACRKGTKAAPNHDGFSVVRFDESYLWGPLTMYCVFDGHGPTGELITQLAVDLLPKLLFEQFKKLAPSIPPEGLGYVRTPEELEQVRSAVEEVFVALQTFLEQLTVEGTLCSRKAGTTATVVLQGVERDTNGNEDPWLLVGHVGDSRACLLRPSPNENDAQCGRDGNAESPEVLELTRDHRPDNPREKSRIEQMGARVEAFEVDKGTVRPMDPRVLSDGQDWPALNMSRCLGDLFSHTQGVIELPEVRIKDVQFGDKVIICTDGVWDVITPSEAQGVIQDVKKRNSSSHNPAEAIVNEARKRWVDKTGDFYDDITAIVVDISSF
eukprot:GEMP01004105.1.p1 GENE.GEMP01004105.1~~GEMP01004105.1.p1  ORF type:complete len:885 (+),score=222.90 GEMP01004105.1:202-2856(+)